MRDRRSTIRATRAIDIVEAAYRLEGTESEWLDRLVALARADLDTGCGAYAFTGHEAVPNFPASQVFVHHDLDPQFAERLMEVNRSAPAEIFELLRSRLVTCGGLVQSLGQASPVVTHFRAVMEPAGIADGFSIFAQDAQGGSITLAAPSREVLATAPRVRGIWRRIGLHVASGLRLRRKLAAQESTRDAVLDPSGRVHDARGKIAKDTTARGVLISAVLAMEKARTAAARRSPEGALALWQGLVAGEWSLVEQWESGGRRYVAAYQNRPEVRDPRALTHTERSVLGYLALGATNKEIMYALGLPAGTVSACVTQVFKKLGVHRRVDVAVLADPLRMDRVDVDVEGGAIGVLAIDAGSSETAARALSAAEQAVASYVVRGWNNEMIARERHVSARTIANQLRTIYEKLGVENRSQLVRVLNK